LRKRIARLDCAATTRYNGVVMPQFDEHGNLEPGIWDATIKELGERLAQTPHRKKLFNALAAVLDILRDANCSEAHLDGSFITTASEPGDYDLCYEPTGMVPTEAWQQLLGLTAADRKKKHLGDIFIHMPEPPFFTNLIEFWQTDREGNPKGIIRIGLRHEAND
jgi:hypothetical protein